MTSRETCELWDVEDPLAGVREQFALPERVVYLDGNSLGPMPKSSLDAVQQAASQWAEGLVGSWNSAGWYEAPMRLGRKLAPLLGARETEVAVTDSLSINLYKLLVAGMRLRPDRSVIITERENFPSDLYIAESVSRLEPARGARVVETADLTRAIDESTAVVYLTHVDFRSARMHDMQAVTRRAHDAGAIVLWNLAHSAGAVPLRLTDWNVDLAVGCGYKYLNGGPGAPGFVYIAERHQAALDQPLTGWFGHARPFDFEPGYEPAEGVRRALCGTPPILSFAALEAAIDLWADIDPLLVREKSSRLSDLFIEQLEGCELRLHSPADAQQRGSHLSFEHPQGYAIVQALIARGMIGDFRAPNLMRFGFAPLYTRYVDAFDAAGALREILTTSEWNQPRFQQRREVT